MADRYLLRPREAPRPNSKIAKGVDSWGYWCHDVFWAVYWPLVLLTVLAGVATVAACTVASDWVAVSALWSFKQDLHSGHGDVDYTRLWALAPGFVFTGGSIVGGRQVLRHARAVAGHAQPSRLGADGATSVLPDPSATPNSAAARPISGSAHRPASRDASAPSAVAGPRRRGPRSTPRPSR